ncbi:MAG: fasciclin domain-containing protein [Candidatus Thermoplasmatota archaeon]|nr:fasciclin domain-containing protein [Candidatus Thermoplasmatota archaeon]
MQRKFSTALIALLLMTALPLSVSADETKDIPTNASETGVHDSLVAALTHAGLASTLSGDGPFTVFAPTDQAFADAGIDLASFDTDAENATLVDILTYHVVAGSVMSTDLTDAGTTDALNGDKLSFTVTNTEVKVNDAVVTTADVVSSNGVIHVIDKVLTPPVDVYVGDGSMSEPYFEFYTDVDGTNGMTEIDISKSYRFQRLNNPSAHPFYIGDSGYNTDSSDNLIISGDGTSTTGISDDESFTLFFRDGFTIEDTLSYFCTVHSSMMSDFTLTAPVELVDIPTTATSTGIHTSLVAALAQAELVSTLQGDGPFTVFAPTDDAFAEAGIDLSTFDTDEENETLADILLYHVVAGTVMSSDLTDGMTATAINNDSLRFNVGTDGVVVNDANVTLADVVASNGVIHVIDKVLMPPADEPADEPAEPEIVCDATIGITSDGYGFTPASVTIAVGETVCWKWTNESMAHNVKEVAGLKSTTYVENGVYSGAAAKTVDFHHTFTEDTTFYYACEPHIGVEMFGKVIVGDGGAEPAVVAEDKDDKKDNNTPGFLGLTAILATLGAVLVARKRQENEL